MAAIKLNGKDRYVVYEVTQAAYRKGTAHYQATTHIRILELDHVVLFKRLLTGKMILNRVNDPVVKSVVKSWSRVYVNQYLSTKNAAKDLCKQLTERIQND